MTKDTDLSKDLSTIPVRDVYGDDLRRRIARFQTPDLRTSLAEAITSIGGYLAICAAMYAAAEVSYWIVLVLVPVAAGFLVRTFIIQHDCGHGAFFSSRRMNQTVGIVCSLVTLAPYLSWRRQHAGHHREWNNLDRRNSGADIYSFCLTVDEYRALSPWRQRWYRFTRNPTISNLILPPFVFLVLYRLPFDMPAGWRRERLAVYSTNLGLVALFGTAGIIIGFDRVVEIQLPVTVLASIVGVWLFTVQHRSDSIVWAREAEWNTLTASLKGSTYLRLPRLLQWFTGNIGLHHIHHLNPRIPNYRLQPAHDAIREFCNIPAKTLFHAFKAMFYVLWDERRKRMVTFREVALLQPGS